MRVSKGGSDGEMPGPGGFAIVPGEVVTVFKADGPDREVKPDTESDRKFGGREIKALIESRQVACIEESDAFDRTGKGVDVFGVGNPVALAASGIIAGRPGTELPKSEGPDTVRTAGEEPEVDRKLGCAT